MQQQHDRDAAEPAHRVPLFPAELPRAPGHRRSTTGREHAVLDLDTHLQSPNANVADARCPTARMTAVFDSIPGKPELLIPENAFPARRSLDTGKLLLIEID
ncbi:hypothetical protein [Burkholderia lata]|uniref:hypothetical protein n=1 Tax=Burkholderia lata (strain ATCC 17760 / DSM 23089 / LMG 22485 / NCIMB 9086 / R18194 / 383) TaxID=482957 RepID=UPI0020C615C4|nr:hypothetical protein [Burkholderia lata]